MNGRLGLSREKKEKEVWKRNSGTKEEKESDAGYHTLFAVSDHHDLVCKHKIEFP